MARTVEIVAMGESCQDFIKFRAIFLTRDLPTNEGTSDIYVITDESEIWGVAYMADIIKCDRKFSDVQGALKTAVSGGYTDIGLWGCDYSYPGKNIREDGEDEVAQLAKHAIKKGVKIRIAHSSTNLIKAIQGN